MSDITYVLPGHQVPHSEEAEEAVLGSCLVNPEMIARVARIITPEDFYILRHAYIFEVMIRLDASNSRSDLITIQDALQAVGRLGDIGGTAYLLQLVNNTPNSTYAETYARIVERAAIRRHLLAAADEVKALAIQEDLPIEKVMVESERRISRINKPNTMKLLRVQDVAKAHFARTSERKELGIAQTGIPSVINPLSSLIGGYQESKLIITAGRPGIGKSSHLYCETIHACNKLGVSVLFETLEVSALEVIDNLCAIMIAVPVMRVRAGLMNEEEWDRYCAALNRIDQWSLFINDDVGSTTSSVRTDALTLMDTSGVGLVIVDYLQLMSTSDRRMTNRADIVGSFAEDLKKLAKELNTPILAGAQLNRALEQREDKRPTLSDLRESGAIEQSADVVIGIHREDYYEKSDNPPAFSHTEFIVLKNRDGATGIANAGLYTRYKKFVPAYAVKGGGWEYSA